MDNVIVSNNYRPERDDDLYQARLRHLERIESLVRTITGKGIPQKQRDYFLQYGTMGGSKPVPPKKPPKPQSKPNRYGSI